MAIRHMGCGFYDTIPETRRQITVKLSFTDEEYEKLRQQLEDDVSWYRIESYVRIAVRDFLNKLKESGHSFGSEI